MGDQAQECVNSCKGHYWELECEGACEYNPLGSRDRFLDPENWATECKTKSRGAWELVTEGVCGYFGEYDGYGCNAEDWEEYPEECTNSCLCCWELNSDPHSFVQFGENAGNHVCYEGCP